jgi:hypothetical protein
MTFGNIRMQNFTNEMNQFSSEQISSEQKKLPHLKIFYKNFVKILTKDPSQIPSSFTSVYPMNLQFCEQQVLRYTKFFREKFPELRIEKQSITLLAENNETNPLLFQWGLINSYVHKHPDELNLELEKEILKRHSNFDRDLFRVTALLAAGAKVSPKLACEILLKSDDRLLKLLWHNCATSLSPHFSVLFEIENIEKKKEIVKTWIKAGIDVQQLPLNEMISALEDDFALFKFFIEECNYNPVSSDFKQICNIRHLKIVLRYFELFKRQNYSFTYQGQRLILLKLLKRHLPACEIKPLIELVCPEQTIDSELFRELRLYIFPFSLVNFVAEDTKRGAALKNCKNLTREFLKNQNYLLKIRNEVMKLFNNDNITVKPTADPVSKDVFYAMIDLGCEHWKQLQD